MSTQWHQEYIQLAFHIEKIFKKQVELPYVDYYYGPPEWKAQVEEEPEHKPEVLLHMATTLLETLDEQGFEQQRATYLSKQVGAMEMACRKLNGEQFSLPEEMQQLFDIPLTWTPEAQFDDALAIYRAELPGKGTLADRLHQWRKQHSIPREKRALIPAIVERILAEIRRRTLALVDLPANESIDGPHLDINDDFGGACWYQGNYRSHIDINIEAFIERGLSVSTLVDDLCHEIYPGHHTTYTLHEQQLYRMQGYLEEAIGLTFSPAITIAEGIANWACEMLFTPAELETWLTEYIYPELGIVPDGADVTKLQQAADILNGLGGNTVLMLREGKSEEEIQAYLAPYMRQPPLAFLQLPFHQCFPVVEPYAKRLMQPWLQGPGRQQMFRRFLVEQWYPSQLVK